MHHDTIDRLLGLLARLRPVRMFQDPAADREPIGDPGPYARLDLPVPATAVSPNRGRTADSA